MKIKELIKTTLAKDMPAGPYPGQFAHSKGAEVALAEEVESVKIGTCTFVSPDPVFLYLNISETSLVELKRLFIEINKNAKQLWFKDSKIDKKLKALKEDLVYEYFQYSMQFVVMLFSAVEAFLNQNIPSNCVDYKTKGKDGKLKDYKDKENFERTVSTMQKMVFLSEIKSLESPKKQLFWPYFKSLNHIRDEIIHLKTKGKSTSHCYRDIYKDLIDTDFEKMFEFIKSLFVFFEKDFFI